MTQPPPYTRQFDFSDFQDEFPDQPLPGNQVDIELNTVRTSLNAAITNLGLIQADDGDLRNNTVAPENLDTDALTLLSNGLNFTGNWATATEYAVGDVVRYTDGATYVAATAHTSGTFDTDLTAGDWVLLANPVGALGDIVYQKHDGDAIEDTFSLPVDVIDEKQLFVFVEGLVQDPATAYTVNANQITFTTPPPEGTGNILIFGVDMTAVVSANEAAASAAAALASEDLAEEWASKTDGIVDATDYSSKAYAIGGTGVTDTAGKGAAKEWAITTGATVDGTDYGAKEHAVGTTVTTGSSKDWASKTDGLVQAVDGSSKAWAVGGTGVTATASAGASKEWATKTSAAVDTSEFSAKEYAQGSQASTGGSSKNWAQQTGADVTGAAANSRSAKSWAQDANTGATLGGSSKDWAQTTGGTVNGTEFSSKEYAVGTTVTAGSAKDWATKTSGTVIASNYSSKEWATGTQTRGAASGGSSKDWANYTGGTVDNSEYSSKYYAQQSSTSASNASSSETAAAASAAAAAATLASALWRDVIFITQTNSPYTIDSTHNGKLIVCDTSGGAIAITLPQISGLTLPFQVGIKKESTDTTAVTISRAGTDTIDGSTSKVVSTSSSGTVLIADTDPSPDVWTAADFGAVAGNMTADLFSGNNSDVNFTLSVAPGSVNNVSVFISGVRQRPTTDYTVSSTTLTFGTAPASGTNNILAVSGTTLSIGTPSDGTVTEAKLSLSDNTTADVSTTKHGFVPKAPNDATKFLDGTGAWDTVKDSDLSTSDITTNNATTSKHGFMPKLSNSATLYFDSLGTQTNPALNAVLTGYTSGAGTVAATDTVLQAIQKLNGNAAAFSAAGLTTIASGNLATGSPTVIDIGGIPATYRSLVLYVDNASNSVATRGLNIQVACGGDSLPPTTNYMWMQIAGTTITRPATSNTTLWTTVTQTAAQASACVIYFPAYQSGPIKQYQGKCIAAGTANALWQVAATQTDFWGHFASGIAAETRAITGIRITWDNVATGAFDAGTYALYGVQ